MAYLSFTSKGQQLGRRALNGSSIIGRAPDCDIAVRDILLSRHHCKLELVDSTWTLLDMGSKNGTIVSGQTVTRHPLLDGDTFSIGQTVVKFRGAQLGYKPSDAGKPIGSRRPADPWEALEGTVCGFEFSEGPVDVQELGNEVYVSQRPISSFPKPQPSPKDPAGYVQEDLYSMLTEIASSSWDSIYSHAKRHNPVRPPPRPIVHQGRHPRHPESGQQALLALATRRLLEQAHPPKSDRNPKARWGKTLYRMFKGFAAVAQWVLLAGVILH